MDKEKHFLAETNAKECVFGSKQIGGNRPHLGQK